MKEWKPTKKQLKIFNSRFEQTEVFKHRDKTILQILHVLGRHYKGAPISALLTLLDDVKRFLLETSEF